MTITKIFNKAEQNNKIKIDKDLSAKYNKVIGVGYNSNCKVGVICMDRPIKSPLTAKFMNAQINSLSKNKAKSFDRIK